MKSLAKLYCILMRVMLEIATITLMFITPGSIALPLALAILLTAAALVYDLRKLHDKALNLRTKRRTLLQKSGEEIKKSFKTVIGILLFMIPLHPLL